MSIIEFHAMITKQPARQTEKKRLENMLFYPPKDGEAPPNVAPADVVRFLKLAGQSHRKGLFHYTNVDALEKILSSRQILLSRGSDMNDLCEFKSCDPKLWERAYVASFSYGPQECVAMWKMYGEMIGGEVQEAVRLGFPTRGLTELAKKLAEWQAFGFDPESQVFSHEKFPIKSASLHDVMYRSGRNIEWHGLHAGTSRCGAFEDARKERLFATYVKDAGWSYERETRLVVVLEKPCEYSRIAIPIDGVVKDLKVLLGPCAKESMKAKEKRVSGICRKNSLKLEISKSEYEVEWNH